MKNSNKLMSHFYCIGISFKTRLRHTASYYSVLVSYQGIDRIQLFVFDIYVVIIGCVSIVFPLGIDNWESPLTRHEVGVHISSDINVIRQLWLGIAGDHRKVEWKNIGSKVMEFQSKPWIERIDGRCWVWITYWWCRNVRLVYLWWIYVLTDVVLVNLTEI